MARINLLLVVWMCMLYSSGLAQKTDKNKDKKNDKDGDDDEETSSPTTPPSLRPTPLLTEAPLMPLPLGSTEGPTSRPSITSSSSPSVAPVTITPSVAPVTAAPSEPTPAPILLPTVAPSEGPTEGPSVSSTPTKFLVVTQVVLPEIVIGFRVTEGPVIAKNLENDIQSFVKDVVVSNSKILGELDRVELAVSVSSDGRRELEEKLKATLEGSAYFEGDIFPTTDRLEEVLTAYFANWGDADLEDHLSNGEVQVQGVEVAIDGELVQSLSPDSVDRSIPSDDSGNDGGVRTGLIIGLVAGCVVLVSALALVYVRRQKRNTSTRKYRSTPMSSPTRRSRSTGSPPVDVDPEEVDALSFSGKSMDDGSLYTTGTPNSKEYYQPSSQDHTTEYDPTRLDKVISGARDFVANHEGGDQASFPSYDADSIESIDSEPRATDIGSISSDVMYI